LVDNFLIYPANIQRQNGNKYLSNFKQAKMATSFFSAAIILPVSAFCFTEVPFSSAT